MINDISDLELNEEDSMEVLESKIKDKLGVDFDSMKNALSKFIKDNLDEVSEDFVNIIPYGDYGKLLEDKEEKCSFLLDEASKLENWKLYYLMPSDANPELIQFVFKNGSVDEGDVFEGHVFVSKSGKIRHAFTQVS